MASSLPLSLTPISTSEQDFGRSLCIHSNLVRVFEDAELKKYALQCIPVDELTIKATQLLSTNEKDFCLEDCLILELLPWFKFSFFTWMDRPKCPKCGGRTGFKGTFTPLEDELRWLARTVERYYCDICNVFTRFPRYNHPRKLLETRIGRCGEWTNCFALICRALDLDVRLVMDWNDHIWVEMFSPSMQRWVHCDPCENIFDQPLLYEMGWKKDIVLVIAFSKDEVQDVTWRYTQKFSEVLKRRKDFQCREEFVAATLKQYTEECRANASPERRKQLLKRQVQELAEFLSPPKASDESLAGRTSGSMSWRLARGETSAENVHTPYVFNLSEREIENKTISIEYNCASDKYIRLSDGSSITSNWKALAFEVKNIFRKVELDWNMCYLARTEGSTLGMIMWKFDFSKTGLVIKNFHVQAKGKTFEKGRITWHLTPIKSYGPRIERVFQTESLSIMPYGLLDFEGACGLTIMAELWNEESHWQHSQLFRQDLSNTKDFSFVIEVNLKEDDPPV